MSWIRELLGLGSGAEAGAGGAGAGRPETETVRRIAGELERLPAGRARFVAAFAAVLARVARVDLHQDPAEVDAMQRLLAEAGELEVEEAGWIVELAGRLAEERGGTDAFLATRELRESASREQRARLVECAFAVGAADGGISVAESEMTLAIAQELGFTKQEALGLRARWKEHLEEFRRTPKERERRDS